MSFYQTPYPYPFILLPQNFLKFDYQSEIHKNHNNNPMTFPKTSKKAKFTWKYKQIGQEKHKEKASFSTLPKNNKSDLTKSYCFLSSF